MSELLCYLEEYLDVGLYRLLNTLLLGDFLLGIGEYVKSSADEFGFYS